MEAIEAILGRISSIRLVEPGPDPGQLKTILEAAARAPDHGRLQPWRFILIDGDARLRFGNILANALRRREPDVTELQLNAERKKPLRAPLIVVVAAAVKAHAKIREIEQLVAAGAAAQNILLATHALGLGGFWRTGAPAYDAQVKSALGLAPTDAIVGFLYLGTIAVPGAARRIDPAATTRQW